nr:hypothetical protein [uncultured Massilia sp.]
MRDLDKLNPELAHPNRILPLAALLPFLVGGLMWLMASGAYKGKPFYQDVPSMLCVTVMAISVVIALLSKLQRLGWHVRYFGIGSFYMGSASLFGLVPWLCIVLYGNSPLWKKVMLLVVYGGVTAWWCMRFVVVYRRIMSVDEQARLIYQEELDAIYYVQKADGWLLAKRYKFEQSPHAMLYVGMCTLGFLALIFNDITYRLLGAPGIYGFMLIAFFPVVLLTLGLATRGYLIYYHFPRILKKKTGKHVYIDMSSKTIH